MRTTVKYVSEQPICS